MADFSVTATSVAPVADSTTIDHGILGAAVTAGQSVFKHTDGTYKLADANASLATAAAKGVALNGGSSGQPVAVALKGKINPGFTGTVGAIVVLSATAGGLAPPGDLATGMYTTIIGVITAASELTLNIQASGALIP